MGSTSRSRARPVNASSSHHAMGLSISGAGLDVSGGLNPHFRGNDRIANGNLVLAIVQRFSETKYLHDACTVPWKGETAMNAFTGKRIVEDYEGRIDAPPNEVFPLLCPIREYDWIDGWECEMIYSDSGFAENNCIFKSEFAAGIEATWVAIKRDDEGFAFEFIIFFPELAVARVDTSLAENSDGTTTLNWVQTMTGLTESGNQLLDHFTGEPFRQRIDWLVESLNHYFKAGEMLKRG